MKTKYEITHSAILHIDGNSVQTRFIKLKSGNLRLPIPIMDKKWENPSPEFWDKVKKINDMLYRASCSPDPTGFLRSCGFEREISSSGTESKIIQKTGITSRTDITNADNFNEMITDNTMDIKYNHTGELTHYDKYRKALDESWLYPGSSTMMEDMATWLTGAFPYKSPSP